LKTTLFAGYTMKHELLLYMGKILHHLGAKTLIVDATANQHYRNIVPVIQSRETLTEYDGFDVAFSLFSYEQAESRLREMNEQIEAYDYLLIDMDSSCHIHSWGSWDQCYLVTGLDRNSMTVNAAMLESLCTDEAFGQIHIVLYPFVECSVGLRDIKASLGHLPAEWGETFYFLLDERDYAVGISNQYCSRISLKGLSRHTKKGLSEMCRLISGEERSAVKKAIRLAERRK
jgi:hypothetical protein